MLIVILILTVGFQIVIVTFGGDFVKTTPLSIYNWLICIGIGAFSLVVGLVSRYVPVPHIPLPPLVPEESEDIAKKQLLAADEDGEASASDSEGEDVGSSGEGWRAMVEVNRPVYR